MKFSIQALTRSPISLIGVAVATATSILIITLIALTFFGMEGGPYIGILAFVILPIIFVVGLILIPVGIRISRNKARKQAAKGGDVPEAFPIINLNLPATRRVVLIVLLLTVVNVVILSVATFEAVEVMETNEFCGTACHTVMEPEWTAYQESPHSRVNCVDCHIGPGANWFVKSKLSGTYQLIAVAFDLYPRPVPTPVHNLRPARDTCEQCHWPTKFVGNKMKVRTHYDTDEESTELITALLLKVGGLKGDSSEGIHWHVDPGVEIRYDSDETRETIYDVELTLPDGTTKLYRSPEKHEDGEELVESRLMDCVDCHNRPTHIYKLPGQAIDDALLKGHISRTLPFIRKEAARALRGEFASSDEAREAIENHLVGFYRDNGTALSAQQNAALEQAVESLTDIWSQNVFPKMNVTWGTYPDHIGHEQSPGCFRCHNDEHATADGEVISGDCDVCHSLLAMEEERSEALDSLGLDL
jgi:hypothetical protein